MRRSLTWVVLLLIAAMASVPLRAAEEISGELVGLNVSLAAEKQLVVHDQLVAAEEWDSALDLLDRLQVEGGDVLVKVAPGRFVGLPVAIQQRLCRLPAAGLEVYQKRRNPVALTLLTRARETRDEAALWRIIDESSATTAAPEALHSLAAQAAARGDLELALRLWGRLRDTEGVARSVFPAPLVSLPVPDFRESRTALLKAIVGRHGVGVALTKDEMSVFGGEEAAAWKLAGRPLSDWVQRPATRTEAATTLGSLRWTARATANCPLPEYQTPLSVQSSRGGLLLLNNGQQVRALNADDGEPYWASGLPNDVGVVLDDPLADDETARELPCRIAEGVSTRDRYFGVLGDAPRFRPRPGLVPLAGSLVSIDVAQGQGRVQWREEARDLPEPEWLFHGRPSLSAGAWPSEDLVVVPLCRPAPQVELAIAAFSQDDGHLVWWTRIGTCAAAAGQPLPETQLAAKAGLVVARTLTGVVVAIEARHGRVQWASTAMVASPPAQQGSPAPLLDARAGVLVVADPIQSQVAGFSLDSGEKLWQVLLPYSVQGVVSAPQGKVLIAGTRLRAVTLLQGTPLWEHGSDDVAAAGTGVPLVVGSSVVWPTRSGLWGLDLDRGAIEFQRVLSVGPIAGPMQIVRVGSRWCVSMPDTMAVFE